MWVAVREEKLWRDRRKSDLVRWVELPFLNDADVRTIWKLHQLLKRERIEILLPTRSRDYWLAGFARMLEGNSFGLTGFRAAAILVASSYFVGMIALIWAPETKDKPLPE